MRRLRLLQIEDNKRLREDTEVVRALERVTFCVKNHRVGAISSLQDATCYWQHFDMAYMPDIIVSDINFEDDVTTPLQRLRSNDHGDKRKSGIPSGIMHLKPFAAMARSLGRPIEVAFVHRRLQHLEKPH